MRDDPIRAGSVVHLKSGGPPMTANRADGDGWECLWFAGEELRWALIAGEALEPDWGVRGPKPIISPYPTGAGDGPPP